MNKIAIIPQPKKVQELGGVFALNSDATIAWNGNEAAKKEAEFLAEYLRPATGFALPVVEGEGTITFSLANEPEENDMGFRPEGHKIVAKDGKVLITGESSSALGRAIQTLRQLFPAEIYASTKQAVAWEFPEVEIEDKPELQWRGMHLDVSRHFSPKDEVLRFIELIAQHKYSIFHWHLTDDQGWRIEIKKYPKLTEVGAWRKETLIGHDHRDKPHRFDGKPHGGFYTQEEVKEIVAYAARRHIVVIPEINTPGHAQAMIAAYPEFGMASLTTPEVRTRWHISHHVLNMEDATVEACKDIWREVFTLFPSKYCHIGGDECPTNMWDDSKRVYELMIQRGIKGDPRNLQCWYTGELNKLFKEHGRRMIGWAEITHGDFNDTTVIPAWWWGGTDYIKLIDRGFNIIQCANQFLYFDYAQCAPIDEEPLAINLDPTQSPYSTEHVYSFVPYPNYLTEEQKSHILGCQGQLWREYIPNMAHLEYMAFPRATALAEVLWSEKSRRNYRCFLKRLATHRARFDVQGVNACDRP